MPERHYYRRPDGRWTSVTRNVTTLWEHPVTEVQVGDVWCATESDRVLILEIDTEPLDDPAWQATYPNGIVRLHGRIIKGYGAGKAKRVWVFGPDRLIDIERPQHRD